MKYALIAAIVIATLSLTICSEYLAQGVKTGLIKKLYCKTSFLHFFPRQFSVIDILLHFFIWIVISIVVLRIIQRYAKGRVL